MSIAPLPPDLEQFVQDQLAQGKYHSASEVVADAVRLLRERVDRLASLRADIDQGIVQLDRGQYVDLDSDGDIDAFFDDAEERASQRLKPTRDDV
jgi:antitoxin ParD1/3/4